MKDFHLHSTFSFDGTGSIDDYFNLARTNNYKAICFTEHDEILESLDSFQNYIYYITRFQNKDENTIILKGLEIDINKILYVDNGVYNNLDFILCSLHFNAKTPVEYYRKLFELLSNKRIMNKFDSIAHIDFPLRYSIFASSFFKEFYKDSFFYIERILNLLINNNKSLELNTANFLGENKEISFKFWNELLNIFEHNNGALLTIGSDSHSIDDFIKSTKNRNSILNELGLNEDDFIIYKNHKYM